MCFYSSVRFYTLNPDRFIHTWKGELYIPLNTCTTEVKIFTPIIDVSLAKGLAVLSTVGGVLIAVAAAVTYRKRSSPKRQA